MRTPRIPHFLIIGAMKAGTTSLYEDLRQIPGVYLPPEKEPNDLVDSSILEPTRKAQYFAKFVAARADDLCGEASTAYSKMPDYAGVPERALALLGPELKIIYMCRDPIRRIISHYYHLWGLGLETRPLNQAVLEDASYVDYSLYDYQLACWRKCFDPNKILVIQFEEYISNHAHVLFKVASFLGVEAPTVSSVAHRNASAGKRVVRKGSFLDYFRSSKIYLYSIKPLLGTKVRDTIKSMILVKVKPMNDKLTSETEAELLKRLNSQRSPI